MVPVIDWLFSALGWFLTITLGLIAIVGFVFLLIIVVDMARRVRYTPSGRSARVAVSLMLMLPLLAVILMMGIVPNEIAWFWTTILVGLTIAIIVFWSNAYYRMRLERKHGVENVERMLSPKYRRGNDAH